MEKYIIFAAILACASAAPALLLTHNTDLYHIPLAKTTVTNSNQIVNHGSTLIHTPVVPIVHSAPVIHAAPVSAKTTITKSSQVVNHGGTTLFHSVPVVHNYHVPEYHEVSFHVPQKTTVTKSKQVVNHGSTALVHAPVVPVVHAAPVVHSAPVLVHSSPLVTFKTGDSAVSHHSSTVHETVPVLKSLSLLSYHH